MPSTPLRRGAGDRAIGGGVVADRFGGRPQRVDRFERRFEVVTAEVSRGKCIARPFPLDEGVEVVTVSEPGEEAILDRPPVECVEVGGECVVGLFARLSGT